MVSVQGYLSCLLWFAGVISAASLQHITEPFGDNPTNVGFYLYVPDKLSPRPPVLIHTHGCHGTAEGAYKGYRFPKLADQYGFIVIYPDSPFLEKKCWDVSSRETLTHNGGGDSLGIASMVRWTLDKYAGDRGRVFATGVSSGAMITNVLMGSYPDLFAGGSAFAGVPFGCYAAPGNNSGVYWYWDYACAAGNVTHTPRQWKAMVDAAYPGYTGWRPKVQVFHGTVDEVLNYNNFGEEIKQWTAVFGLDYRRPASITENTPKKGWTKSSYGGGWFEAFSAFNVTHNIQMQEDLVLEFFDLKCNGQDCFSWGKGGPRKPCSKRRSPVQEHRR
ncbi:uncharacterized protein E0L32_007710 [Thyridium curvatum]|uniref:Carboxylic ester hydrolase n=1 Tax=Thyridium curvatum TaxID=1093900 RepID=A0A507B2I4_9PEZI|nr:uncharacterized protein E0L32_007710 [Thyridium curvatum]TPX11499.1 hypothetical protein E0L32_007710 [Thyridium curvatum]